MVSILSSEREGVIPYDLIVPSASRPHLLERVLHSLLEHVDQKPRMLIVHDDAAFPGRQHLVYEVVMQAARTHAVPVIVEAHDPPLNHGPSVHWLLQHVETPYVLYSQDDHIVVRDLPITRCLDVMQQHDLHHVRFNKRATMDYKGEFKKIEVSYRRTRPLWGTHTAWEDLTLCVSDHWYFQTSLWRVARIKPVVDWWMQHHGASFHEHCEVKVNRTFNGQIAEFGEPWPLPNALGHRTIDPTTGVRRAIDNPMDPLVRQTYQRTFIWGKIGEERYIEHIGGDPADWALWRPRGGHGGPRDSQNQEVR